MKIQPLPSLEYLAECFILDETCPSGLRWKVRPQNHFPTPRGCATANSQRARQPAGCLQKGSGIRYYVCGVTNKIYPAHRIVYSMFHGITLPTDTQIDHRDTNPHNNLPSNLRISTCTQNRCNTKFRSDNKSGSKGVFYREDIGAWRGVLNYKGVRYQLGSSPCKETMTKIVSQFREELHGEFCHHGE